MLITVDMRFLFKFLPALSAHHTNVIYMVASRCAYGKPVVYVAGLVDRLATYLATIIIHLQSQIALFTTITVPLSILMNYP